MEQEPATHSLTRPISRVVFDSRSIERVNFVVQGYIQRIEILISLT